MGGLDRTHVAIWSYWEHLPNAPRPAYIAACETTIRRHADDLPVRVLDRSGAEELMPHIPKLWHSLSPVQRSDIVRVEIIRRFGGIWLDLDTIALRSLTSLLDHVNLSGGFVGFDDGGISNGLFASHPHHPFLEEMSARQRQVLDSADRADELHWTALGSEILTEIAANAGWTATDRALVAPISWRDADLFVSRTLPVRQVISHETVTVVLYNALLSDSIGQWSTERVLRSNMLVARLLRRGLGVPPLRSEPMLESLSLAGKTYRRLKLRQKYRSLARERARLSS